MIKKARAQLKVKRALVKLDKAVQNWYKVNAPENIERYATLHIRDYPERKLHVCNLTVHPDIKPDDFIDIISPTEKEVE